MAQVLCAPLVQGKTFILQAQPLPDDTNDMKNYLDTLVEAVVQAVVRASQSGDLESALMIRDQLQRLPDNLITEVINGVLLRLVNIDPLLCRWFILDVFLREADPEGKADVAERINLLMAELRSSS